MQDIRWTQKVPIALNLLLSCLYRHKMRRFSLY
uniref:Uncharacterized protein n=1 Tax=Rhizophora mucronata TaxID=61149 RepID=A0A2P2NLL6_RHIMU